MKAVKHIGHGAENDCYLSTKGTVIKVPHLFGQLWQKQEPEHFERCTKILAAYGIRAIQTTVVRNCSLTLPNGTVQEKPFVLESPYFENLNEEKIGFDDMLDEEKGPKILRGMLEIIRKATKIYEEEQLGLDLVGGPIYGEILNGLKQNVILELSKHLPASLQQKVRASINGLDIKVDNLIDHEGELLISDIGLWDLSKDGKFVILMETFLKMVIHSLILILESANKKLPKEKQLRSDEFKNIGPNINIFQKAVVLKLIEIIVPLLYLKTSSKPKTSKQSFTHFSTAA